MKILFLDDDKSRRDTLMYKVSGDTIDWVTNFTDFVKHITENRYDLIMLDHDLGDDSPENGYDIAKWIVDHWDDLPSLCPIVIHSMNCVGNKNMLSVLAPVAGPMVHSIPGGWTKISANANGFTFSV